MIFSRRLRGLVPVLLCLAATALPAAAADPIRILALGDSLTAGYGLPPGDAFPVRLEEALKARGHHVRVINAGVSGDTADQGFARLDWALAEGADAAIVEFGANDALRGIDPKVTRQAIDGIVGTLTGRGIPVLLAGMLAPRNMGPAYQAAYDPIFPEVAARYGVIFDPFFLEGVVLDPALNQRDGIHPNRAGVDRIVARILPKVEELIGRVRAKRS
ncbi:arylesterase [Prosthecomicrobium sp. N25]|uniref:arylesterase n=1 Tax=Prosthecomicrobium sp. N25 TaxID=3129254 RepID=UPI003077EF0C